MPIDPLFTSKVKIKEQAPPNKWWEKLDGRRDELENVDRWKWPNAKNRPGRGKSRAEGDAPPLC